MTTTTGRFTRNASITAGSFYLCDRRVVDVGPVSLIVVAPGSTLVVEFLQVHISQGNTAIVTLAEAGGTTILDQFTTNVAALATAVWTLPKAIELADGADLLLTVAVNIGAVWTTVLAFQRST